MFQNLLKLLVLLSKYNIFKIKVIFWYFKQKYVYSIYSILALIFFNDVIVKNVNDRDNLKHLH